MPCISGNAAKPKTIARPLQNNMIAISIVSHGQRELVEALLKDLDGINSNLVTRIVITHNASDDRHAFPNHIGCAKVTQIINSSPKGFGANHNAAFKTISEPFFAVLNPDLRMNEDPFPALLKRLEDPRLAVAAPKILNPDGTVAVSARSLYTPLSSVKSFLLVRTNELCPVWLAGMFLLFNSSAYNAASGFDEDFFMYVEDVDICSRLTMLGWGICYEQSVAVVHDAQRANRKSIKHLRWHLGSALRWWTSRVFWEHRKYLRYVNTRRKEVSEP
jgi:N-acetylglucosaminyl-diphospho-decaprenol L-rhamnosyltransferase